MALIYPESPLNIPKDLTKLPEAYKFKSFLAILSIILFFTLYTLMVIGLGYLLMYAITFPMITINKFTILGKLGAIAGAGMLFIFTLKFIFKLQNPKIENRIKLEKSENKELWDFVDQICKETNAPRPKNIYVDPDVNAYVSYSNLWLSLFFPIKKELTIGMSLTSGLNLTEFKAVVAHEFGHFAQRSMKIGSYIHSANTIIHGMIFSRDKFDEILERWRGSDIRLSIAAWLITPIIWIIRQILNLFYQLLNIMYSSLSREMEFNADKVAVSVSGSDGIVSALWKLDSAAHCWNETLDNAYLATKKEIYVKNLYYHNDLALNDISNEIENKLSNLPTNADGLRQFFSSSEQSKVSMYASHPPNDLREKNAKSPFIETKMDSRSPWILFGSGNALKEEMTLLLYKQYFDKKVTAFVEDSKFTEFIKQEALGKEVLNEYHNSFENRFLNVPEKESIKTTNISTNSEKLKSELKDLMKPVWSIEEQMKTVEEIANGTSSVKNFTFEGKSYTKSSLEQAFQTMFDKREELFNNSFNNWDLNFCAHHYQLANASGKSEEFFKLLDQHKQLSSYYRMIVMIKNKILERFNKIQEKEEVQQYQINDLAAKIDEYLQRLNKQLNKIGEKEFISLPNIETPQLLRNAIVEGGKFKRGGIKMFENSNFGRILNDIDLAIQSCQRVDQKSISQLLIFFKELNN